MRLSLSTRLSRRGVMVRALAAFALGAAARHQLRPRSPALLAKYAKDFPKVQTFTIDEYFGGWTKAQKEHFDDGAIFDQILSAAKK